MIYTLIKQINKDYILIDTLKEAINRYNVQSIVFKNMQDKSTEILKQRKGEVGVT